MSKFKVGDKVKLLKKPNDVSGHPGWTESMDDYVGKVGVITLVRNYYTVDFKEYRLHLSYKEEWLELATTPHKHHVEIKAWADGAKIQCKYPLDSRWVDISNPTWCEHLEYRVAPEIKEDVVITKRVRQVSGVLLDGGDDKVQYTFDGESGELKEVKIV